MKSVLLVTGVLAMALPAGAGTASWIHVAVDDGHSKPTTVRVNLPLAAVDAVTPLIQQELAKNAKLEAKGQSLDKAHLTAMWKAVKDAGDAEFVTVRGQGDDVRVAKVRDKLIVKVSDAAKGKDTVTVEIPAEVVDALLSGPGDQLDFAAAIEVLKQRGHGTLVTVDDASSKVRVWIDDRNVSE
jgi:hypothetical protein